MCRTPSTCPCHVVSDCGKPKSPTLEPFAMNKDSVVLSSDCGGYTAATEFGSSSTSLRTASESTSVERKR